MPSPTPYKFDPIPASKSDLFYFDWSDWLAATPGESIDPGSITVTATPAGLTIPPDQVLLNGSVVRARITASVSPNLTFTVSCSVTSAPGQRSDSAEVTLYITR